MTRRRPSAAAAPVSRPPNEGWTPARTRPLRGRVALVAGATRGAGRAIAVSLALAGAKVYATGRSVRGRGATPGRPETIDETGEIIRSFGGTVVPLGVDHTDPDQVHRLMERIRRAESGRLDVLVNDIWGGEDLVEWGEPPWAMSWEKGRTMIERAVFSHMITSRFAVPLFVRRRRGLVIEVTDGVHSEYRGSFFYDFVKSSVNRLAVAYDAEFKEAGLRRMAAIAVTPGFLRSEYILDKFGVTEENWRDGIPRARHFNASETPYYLARGIVALAADPRVHTKSGRGFGSWTLAREYRFTDRDGTRPNWGAVAPG